VACRAAKLRAESGATRLRRSSLTKSHRRPIYFDIREAGEPYALRGRSRGLQDAAMRLFSERMMMNLAMQTAVEISGKG